MRALECACIALFFHFFIRGTHARKTVEPWDQPKSMQESARRLLSEYRARTQTAPATTSTRPSIVISDAKRLAFNKKAAAVRRQIASDAAPELQELRRRLVEAQLGLRVQREELDVERASAAAVLDEARAADAARVEARCAPARRTSPRRSAARATRRRRRARATRRRSRPHAHARRASKRARRR